MTLFAAGSTSPFSFFHDVLRTALKLAWGPSADPNKLAPLMAQYVSAQEWPDWCRVSTHGSHLVKVAFLDSLPRFIHHFSVLDQVDNIRLRRLSHYKCNTDWNHEFVRADLVDEGSNTPLVMVWQRDLLLTGDGAQKQRRLSIRCGLPCDSIDIVSYITEANFAGFVKWQSAYLVRTADFPTPGPNILQLASVLETHSLSFPTHHVYSTMDYWYAESTFEVLVELGKAKVRSASKSPQKRGFWSWLGFIAYSGVTRRSLAETGNVGPDPTHASEDDIYWQQLVKIEGDIVMKYDNAQKKAWGEELATLPAVEREAIEQNGWNVAQFLSMVQDMPTHQKLIGDSIARAKEVREALENIQYSRKEKEVVAKHKMEATKRAEMEEALTKQEEELEHILSGKMALLEQERAKRERELEQARQEREQERAKQERELERARQEREQERAKQERELEQVEREKAKQEQEWEQLQAEIKMLKAELAKHEEQLAKA
ncbi:hypothetical protein O1611_g2721 [Lasiodiplodia mahajangana]|uniref:Uncharacterized protein n=1 Tax=Lasiodiplodia mahajangana TaxID=1108764 RepID=A0ACC2JUA9_9PEZI|nr:hypothetical protein O1611_g2721 [Lasiodiplodia mahajangana]